MHAPVRRLGFTDGTGHLWFAGAVVPPVCGGCQKCVGQLCMEVYETTEANAEEGYGQIWAEGEFICRQLLLAAFSVALARPL